MSFKSGVTTRVDNAQAILDAIRSLTKKDVLVGIPSEDSERDDVPFGNAGIGYVNEYGSPAQNIPPRPHLVPGVKSVEEQTVPQLKAAAQAALDGNAAGAERALNRAGTLAANGVRRYMTITRVLWRTGQAVEGVIAWFKKLNPATQQLIALFSGLLVAWRLLNTAFMSSPLGMITTLIIALGLLWDDYRTFVECQNVHIIRNVYANSRN